MAAILSAGVVGHPIHHSLSPEIFSFLSDRLGIPISYQKIDVSPHDLKAFVASAKKHPKLNGWNVTLPHKEAMATLVDHLSPEGRVMGAINGVRVVNGVLEGHNTDVIGVVETLQEHALERDWARGHSAFLVGAGGAALAVGYALGKLGLNQVWIVNRTRARAEKMAQVLRREFMSTEYSIVALESVRDFSSIVSLYVNATPLGMAGYSAEEVILPQRLTPGALAFDLVYRPEDTPFLKRARDKGLQTVGGLDMLIGQALATWEIWVNEILDRETVKVELKDHLIRVLRADGGRCL